MKKTMNLVLLSAVLVAGCSLAAQARRGDLLHEDIVVEKGETRRGDVATDKSIRVDGTLNGDAVSIGGASITVNGEITGDVVAIGGEVFVPGAVRGDVASIGGPVEISGSVRGDVASMGGGVTLSGKAEVGGDISALGGSVVKGEKAVHNGDVRNFDLRAARGAAARALRLSHRGDGEDGLPGWLVGGLIGAGVVILLSMVLTGLVLMLLPAVFFPANVENAAAAITADIWRACGVGALMLIGFFPGLLIMVVSILGIPLVPFALLIYASAAVVGLSGFSLALQARFFEGIKKAGPASLPGKVATGYGLMAGLLFFGKLIPFVGGILCLLGFMLLAFGIMLGLGAAWTTRMGSKPFRPAAQQPPAVTAVTQFSPPAEQ